MADADVAVIGGGAAGLTAAIFAAERGARVVVFDTAKKLGAKILVSGGGRCNVTHDVVTPDDFHGPRNVIRNVLRSFDEKATVAWFASLGVELKREETGKLFPVTDSAQTVLDALLRRCAALGVEIRPGTRVHDLTPPLRGEGAASSRREWVTFGAESHGSADEGYPLPGPPPGGDGDGRSPGAGWRVVSDAGVAVARRVVVATGGRSLPRSGSDGSGWALLTKLGHTATPTYPALVPLVLAEGFGHAGMSGVALEVELRVEVGGGVAARVADRGPGGGVGGGAGGAAAGPRGKTPLVTLLTERLPRRVAERVLQWSGVSPVQRPAELRREDRAKVAAAVSALRLPVVRDRGWNAAEVTAGGVPMAEVDHRTMASRVAGCAGLHLAGEVLDVEGRIGGFNFQWAWSTGRAAGLGAAAMLGRPGAESR